MILPGQAVEEALLSCRWVTTIRYPGTWFCQIVRPFRAKTKTGQEILIGLYAIDSVSGCSGNPEGTPLAAVAEGNVKNTFLCVIDKTLKQRNGFRGYRGYFRIQSLEAV